jgi:hypothetical protein
LIPVSATPHTRRALPSHRLSLRLRDFSTERYWPTHLKGYDPVDPTHRPSDREHHRKTIVTPQEAVLLFTSGQNSRTNLAISRAYAAK